MVVVSVVLTVAMLVEMSAWSLVVLKDVMTVDKMDSRKVVLMVVQKVVCLVVKKVLSTVALMV